MSGMRILHVKIANYLNCFIKTDLFIKPA